MEVKQIIVDPLDVHFYPENIKVAINGVHDGIVETIELLEEIEFLSDANYVRVVCDHQPEEFLPSCVGLVLLPKVIKSSLKIVMTVC